MVGCVVVSPLLVPLVVIGALLVPGYNLEILGGRFHSDVWFALAWGGFPAFTGYFVNALTVRPAGLLVTAACVLLSVAQRRLSTPVRALRRHTVEVVGEQRMADGEIIPLDEELLEGVWQTIPRARLVHEQVVAAVNKAKQGGCVRRRRSRLHAAGRRIPGCLAAAVRSKRRRRRCPVADRSSGRRMCGAIRRGCRGQRTR